MVTSEYFTYYRHQNVSYGVAAIAEAEPVVTTAMNQAAVSVETAAETQTAEADATMAAGAIRLRQQ